MNKGFRSLAVTLLFLSLQAFSLLHISEYGLDHSHKGKACDICLNSDNKQLLGVNNVDFKAPDLFAFNISSSHKSLILLDKFQNFKSRAPPTFS